MANILDDLKKNPKQAAVAIGILVLALLVVYFNLLLKPQALKIARVYAEAGKKDAELKSAEALIARTDEMKRSIEAYDKKVGRYEKTLPTEHGLPNLLEDLSAMANESRMRIVGIVPLPEKGGTAVKGRAYREIPIMISASSGYHELGRFLSALENCDRFIKVADIRVQAGKVSAKRHDVDLLVLTYVLLGDKR